MDNSLELATAYVSLSTSARGLRTEIDKELGGAADGAGKKAGRTFGDRLKTWGRRGAVAAGAAIAGGLAVALTKGLGRLTAIENAQAKMKGLGHDTKTVDEIMKNALASVKGTAFGLGDAATAAASAVAAGIAPGKELTGHLTNVSNTAAAAGTSFGEMGAIFNKAATQANGVQNDIIGQLADRGIPIYQALADQLGVTAGEVFKMASQGKIDFETFSAAAEAAAGTVADEMGNTLTGSIANAWAAVGRLGATLLGGVFDSLAPAVQGVTGWIDGLDPIAERVGNVVGSAFTKAGSAVQTLGGFLSPVWDLGEALVKLFTGQGTGALAQFFDIQQGHPAIGFLLDIKNFVTDSIPAGLRTVRDLFEGVFNVLTGQGTGLLASTLGVDQSHWIIDAVRGVKDVIDDLASFITGTVIPAISNFIEGFREGEGAGGAFRDILEAIWESAKTTFNFIGETAVPAIRDLYEWLQENYQVILILGAGVLAYNAYMLATAAVTKGVSVATGIWTAAQKALNVVLNLNPIGIIIGLLAALVAALVIAYKNSDTFREVVDKAWAGVKKAVSAVVTWFKDTAWPWMRDAMKWIGDKATSLWQDGIRPAWDFIYGKIKDVVGWVKDTAWPWFRDALQSIGDKASWLYDKAIRPAWDFIYDKIKDVVGWVKDTAWPWMRDAFDNVSTKAGDVRDKVTGAWDKIKGGISSGWDVIKGIFDRMKDALGSVGDKFSDVKDGIARIWGTLGGAIARPINTVIESVNKFLDNLQKNLNRIPGVNLEGTWGSIPTIPIPAAPAQGGYASGYRPGSYADGGVLPGWSPGRDNMHFFSPDHGWLHLAGGEPVMRPEFGAAVGRDWIDTMNRAAKHGGAAAVRKQLGAFSGGGVIPRRGQSFAGGGIISSGLDMLGDLWSAGTGFIKRLIGRLLPDLGDSFIGQAVKGIIDNFDLSSIVDALRSRTSIEDFEGAHGGSIGSPMSWPVIWGIVKGLFPDAELTSTVRPGAVTAGYGTQSLHAQGRAIDFVLNPWSRMVQATKVLSQIGKWTELIHTPAGMWQQSFGRPFSNFLPITKAMHFDHVHVGRKDGGFIPTVDELIPRLSSVMPLLFDNGGYLPKGRSLVDNQTGRPEPLLRGDMPLDLSGDTIDDLRREFQDMLEGNRRTLVRELVTAGRAG